VVYAFNYHALFVASPAINPNKMKEKIRFKYHDGLYKTTTALQII